jgi:hypothetical protein
MFYTTWLASLKGFYIANLALFIIINKNKNLWKLKIKVKNKVGTHTSSNLTFLGWQRVTKWWLPNEQWTFFQVMVVTNIMDKQLPMDPSYLKQKTSFVTL